MKAVILAAGKGTRMGMLTEETPKVLLSMKGKTLIEYKLDCLPPEIDEVIIVVGYLHGKIREYLGESYRGKKIRYVEQVELNGTAGALFAARLYLSNTFLVMMGDDVYSSEDILECMQYTWAICAKKVCDVERGGELIFSLEGRFERIDESKHYIREGYLNSGLYAINEKYFDYTPMPVGQTGEYGIPQTLVSVVKDEFIKIIISDHPWVQISSQEDIKNFEKIYK